MSDRKQIMKIMIIGNSGSGKSTLAKKINVDLSIRHYDLDELLRRRKQNLKKYPHRRMMKNLKEIILQEKWVIEGAYTDIMIFISDIADVLIWMDLNEEQCIKNITARDVSPSNYQIQRTKGYFTRKNGSSHYSHKSIWENFSGKKYQFTSFANELEFIKNEDENATYR